MCLIVTHKVENPLPREHFETAYFANPHGFGVGYLTAPGRLAIQKRTGRPDRAWRMYRDALRAALPGSEVIVHFRLATTGSVRARNAHPFFVRAGVVAHNGIFECRPPKDMTDSEYVLRTAFDLPPEAVDECYCARLENMFDWNKVALLTPDGRVWRVNEALGDWYDGRWYSYSVRSLGLDTPWWGDRVDKDRERGADWGPVRGCEGGHSAPREARS